MQRRIRTAVVLLALAGLAGVWLAAAPFVAPGIDSYQPVGQEWVPATVHHVVAGAALAIASLVAVLTLIATAVRALPEAASAASAPPERDDEPR